MPAIAPTSSSPPASNSWRELNVRLGSIVTRFALATGTVGLAGMICFVFQRMGALFRSLPYDFFEDAYNPATLHFVWAARHGFEAFAVGAAIAAFGTLLKKKGRRAVTILGTLFLLLLIETVVIGYAMIFSHFGFAAGSIR